MEGNVFTVALVGILIPIVAIVGGLIIAGLSMHQRARLRELAYRERIAMIEKGLMPPPETDPQAFESAAFRRETAPVDSFSMYRAVKFRTAGLILMGIGFGLMVLITFAGDQPGAGIGVGGAIALLGFAFNSIFPQMGTQLELRAFTVMVVGGMGSIPGAVIGAYVLGLGEVTALTVSSELRDAFVFGLLFATLVLRPHGLLGTRSVERV